MPEEPILPSDPQPPLATPSLPVSAEPTTPGAISPMGTSGLPPHVAAGLTAVFLVVGSIVFLVIEKKDAFVRFWAMQSLIFGVAWLVLRIAMGFVSIMLFHIFSLLGWTWAVVTLVVNLGLVIVWIIMMVQAFSGKRWEIPFIGPIAKEQLARFTPRI